MILQYAYASVLVGVKNLTCHTVQIIEEKERKKNTTYINDDRMAKSRLYTYFGVSRRKKRNNNNNIEGRDEEKKSLQK